MAKQKRKPFWLLMINDGTGEPTIRKIYGTSEVSVWRKAEETKWNWQTRFIYDAKSWKNFKARLSNVKRGYQQIY